MRQVSTSGYFALCLYLVWLDGTATVWLNIVIPVFLLAAALAGPGALLAAAEGAAALAGPAGPGLALRPAVARSAVALVARRQTGVRPALPRPAGVALAGVQRGGLLVLHHVGRLANIHIFGWTNANNFASFIRSIIVVKPTCLVVSPIIYASLMDFSEYANVSNSFPRLYFCQSELIQT